MCQGTNVSVLFSLPLLPQTTLRSGVEKIPYLQHKRIVLSIFADSSIERMLQGALTLSTDMAAIFQHMHIVVSCQQGRRGKPTLAYLQGR
jgi:hypothetical protein